MFRVISSWCNGLVCDMQWRIQRGFSGFARNPSLSPVFHGIFKKNEIRSAKRTPPFYLYEPHFQKSCKSAPDNYVSDCDISRSYSPDSCSNLSITSLPGCVASLASLCLIRLLSDVCLLCFEIVPFPFQIDLYFLCTFISMCYMTSVSMRNTYYDLPCKILFI